MRPGGRFRRCVLLAVALAAAIPPVAGEDEKVRGVILSTPTDGREWGWDTVVPTLREIRALGAGWVAIHPYAGIGGDGSVRFRDFDRDAPPAYLVRPIREAHKLGLKVVIMPHLAHWGSPFRWRGEIGFEREEEWERFFADYERWIVALADACREADGFVVGSELDRTLAHERRWRRIIRRVRETTPAALTYAANWTDYRRVPFWDALDVIGIQAYFPLSDDPRPNPGEIAAAWTARMHEVREFAAKENRRVVFTELGYNRSLAAASRPWDDRLDGPEAEALQETCLRAALAAVEAEPTVVGVLLWKWFPEPRPVGRTFQLATGRLRRAIADVWKPRQLP